MHCDSCALKTVTALYTIDKSFIFIDDFFFLAEWSCIQGAVLQSD